jgi:hypothetical protein
MTDLEGRLEYRANFTTRFVTNLRTVSAKATGASCAMVCKAFVANFLPEPFTSPSDQKMRVAYYHTQVRVVSREECVTFDDFIYFLDSRSRTV